MDDGELIEVALVENIQRKDLTPFEEAEALHSLTQRFGYTHEELAQRLGKSRTSITESLSLNSMPDEVKTICRLADIASKSLLVQVVRQSDPQKMVALIERLAREGSVTREDARRATAKAKPGRPKAFVFKFVPPAKTFNLRLSFRKAKVDRVEIISALESILEELRHSHD